MSCGCAGRMRKYILPRFGYRQDGDQWVHDTEPAIPDTEIGLHYTAIMVQLVKREGEQAIKRWLDPIVARGE